MPPVWRDQLLDASFRGVPFGVKSAELSGGRKAVVFEYPFKDAPFIEDLGRRARAYRIEGFVVAEDYFGPRNDLLTALETQGVGTLIHPYLGQKLVACTEFQLREAVETGGMAEFAMTFVETDSSIAFAPNAVTSAPTSVISSADSALATVHDRFLSNFALTLPTGRTVPGFSLGSVSALVHEYSARLHTVLAPIMRGTFELAALKRTVDDIAFTAESLVRDPILFAAKFRDAFIALVDWPKTPRLGVTALLKVHDFLPTTPIPAPTTPSRAREAQNDTALIDYVHQLCLIQGARFAASAVSAPGRSISTALDPTQVTPPAGYDSYEDAVAVRQALTDRIDAMNATAPDDVYDTLVQVRADVSDAVPGPTQSLAQLLTETPPVTVPALVLAYRIYGDLFLTEDLIARNHIQRPGFVPGGQPLQVLSHV